MSTSFLYSRQTGGAVRQKPGRRRSALDAGQDSPSAKLVLGEIGAILAIHLAAALAITMILSAYGIAR